MSRKKNEKNEKGIGKRFKAWRLKEELTQAELGKKMKMTPHFFSMLENGKTGLGLNSLHFLGSKMNMDLNWLITGRTKN